ncbi:MAG TPA: hypothetical protein VEP90_12625 [Methylomirabilota bacterium]|nr:hypothetical protein [Methylomirabilota bacterium]
MTTTSQNSMLIAVFSGLDQANQAIDNLRHAGFGYNQIRLVDNGTTSFFEDLKGLFTGHTAAATNSAEDWMRIGVPEQDARFYQSELDAGHSILLSKAINNPEQALSILRQSGAYDIAFRMRNAQPQQPMTQENYNPNIQQGTNNPNPAPAGYEPHTQQGTNNPNVAQGTNNPNAQPGNYDTQQQPHPANTQGE